MTHISIQSQILELSPEATFIWASGTMVSTLEIIGTLHWAQYFAMPGRSVGYCLRMIDIAIQQLKENTKIVENSDILQAINEVLPQLEAIAVTAREIREWQERHVPKKIITAHNKATRESGPREPVWRDQAEFKAKLEKFSSIFSLYLDALDKAIPIIRAILPPDAPTSSEQLDRSQKQIPDIRTILTVGYAEAIRMKAAETGYLPSA